MRTANFVSEDQQMVATLILLKNIDNGCYEGILKYNKIFGEIDEYSAKDTTNLLELSNKALNYCVGNGYELKSY